MSHDCGHETYSGRCLVCKGEGGVGCACGNNPVCNCPPCEACDGTGECRDCAEAFEAEEKYWRAYFGAQLETERFYAREEMERHGRVLTDDERMEEARRLK